MFSLKNPSETNPTNVNPNTTLPNSYGKIRTLKDDYENFRSGKTKGNEEEKDILPPAVPVSESPLPEIPSPPKNSANEISPILGSQPPAPLSSNPLPPLRPQPEEKPLAGKTREEKPVVRENNPYFSEKSPFEEVNRASQTDTTKTLPAKKSGKSTAILASSLLLLIVLGGGFYYYWFYIRKLPAASAPTSSPAQTATPSQNETSKNVQSFPVDPAAGAGAFQTSFQKMTSDFLVSASENSLIETRPVDKNNQQISAKDFLALSSLDFPEIVAQKISSDNFGLFLKKENSEIRTGLVFKLSSSANLTNDLALEEKNLPSRISFLYLDQKPASAEPAFSSSKYKNADIRYYNFPSPLNTSLDYSIISGKDASYLILATSRETLRSILDYMSEK